MVNCKTAAITASEIIREKNSFDIILLLKITKLTLPFERKPKTVYSFCS
jgi:hypothetical protein